MPRRKTPNQLAVTGEPRWLKIRTPVGAEVESRWIAPHSDLRGVLERERERWTAAGWTVEWEPSGTFPGFFMSKEGVRWHVHLTASETPLLPHGAPR